MSQEAQTEWEKWATAAILEEEFDIECLHCDERFPESYVRWHFYRRRPDGTAVLTCRACGCWTPVRFEIENEQTEVSGYGTHPIGTRSEQMKA